MQLVISGGRLQKFELFGFSYKNKFWSDLSGVAGHHSGWWTRIGESFPGAWQQNVEVTRETVLAYPTAYSCISLVSQDIAKMRLRLVEQDDDGIWTEVRRESPFHQVLRKPNHYQTRQKFVEWWISSKLIHGNTYALKVRDNRGIVTSLYILDPTRVRPMVAPDGSVWYQLAADNLARVDTSVFVPAREIIHDVMCPLFHPLVGVSPIYAAGNAALQGLNIQNNSTQFFGNGSNPGGVITAPGAISPENAAAVKAAWDTGFSGDNFGKVAVLGDNMTYQPLAMNANDAQLIEQLKWTSEIIAACFHVPFYMVGGPYPSYNNVQALTQQYYSQCIQSLAEAMEEALDFGLGLAPDRIQGVRMGTEFDIDDLLRMDTATMMTSIGQGIKSGVMKPNEGRSKLGLKPVQGGDTPYLQQQNYSLAALNRRDEAGPPPSSPAVGVPAAPKAKRSFTSEEWVEAKQEALSDAKSMLQVAA